MAPANRDKSKNHSIPFCAAVMVVFALKTGASLPVIVIRHLRRKGA
jgi:hypothetical protein